MPVDLRIDGADALATVARRLKDADPELRRELYRGIQRAAKPMKSAAQRAALVSLPRRGGLNEWVASSLFSVSTRGGQNPAVRLTGRKAGHDLEALERGRLRHPLYGNRRHWYTQQIRPGWFTLAMAAEAARVQVEIVKVLEDIAERLTR